jgi:hypothetical protein
MAYSTVTGRVEHTVRLTSSFISSSCNSLDRIRGEMPASRDSSLNRPGDDLQCRIETNRKSGSGRLWLFARRLPTDRPGRSLLRPAFYLAAYRHFRNVIAGRIPWRRHRHALAAPAVGPPASYLGMPGLDRGNDPLPGAQQKDQGNNGRAMMEKGGFLASSYQYDGSPSVILFTSYIRIVDAPDIYAGR